MKLTPTNWHADRAMYFNSLGIALEYRFKRTGSMDDLNTAIKVKEEAVKLTPMDSRLSRAIYLNNLGASLDSRFGLTGSMDDLNSAVKIYEEVLKLTPKDHPDQGGRLYNLGLSLEQRFQRKGLTDDLNAAVIAFENSVDARLSPPNIRIKSAIRGANLQYSRNFIKCASQMLAAAVKLLPATSPRTLHRSDQQFTLSQFVGLAADACALSIRAGGGISESFDS